MANENQYYKYPFADNGNYDEVPDQASGGNVDYESGYGPDYEKEAGVEGRKRIERTSFNGLFNGATKNIKQHQEHNWPTWIEDDGSSDPATPFSYDAGVVVYHNDQSWLSVVDNNSDEPTSASGKWQVFLLTPARVWRGVTRSIGEVYQNNSGHEIQVTFFARNTDLFRPVIKMGVSSGSFTSSVSGSEGRGTISSTPCVTVPKGYYYMYDIIYAGSNDTDSAEFNEFSV